MDKIRFPQTKTSKFLLLTFFILLCWVLGRIFKIDLDFARSVFSQFSPLLSGFIFVVVYVFVTTLVWFGPKDIFRIVGAIIFGGVLSTVFVWIAELLNATILFHLSRSLGQEFVQEKFRVKSNQLQPMKKDVSFWGILAVRINPLIPFRLMDLGYGLSQISFKKYLIIIFFASLPRIFWLQYILAGVGEQMIEDPSVIFSYLLNNQFLIAASGIYFLGVIVVTVIAIIFAMARKR